MRETSDLHPKWLAYSLLALAVLGVFVFVGNYLLMRVLYRVAEREAPIRSFVPAGDPLPPQPRLQVSPEGDNRAFISSERRKLNEYGWVDPQKGIVRIPVERAMDILSNGGIQ